MDTLTGNKTMKAPQESRQLVDRVGTKQACRALRARERAIQQIVPRGAMEGSFSIVDLISIGTALECSRGGFGVATCRRVYAWASGQSLEWYQDRWHRGSTLLLVVGEDIRFRLMLSRPREVYENPFMNLRSLELAGVPFKAVDTQAVYEGIVERLR